MICVDELGPLAVKTYPGEEWKPGQNRATFEPDYGRRGTLWVLGAFEPATGQADHPVESAARQPQLHSAAGEDGDGVPGGALVGHHRQPEHASQRETQLALTAWPEIQTQFIPKYACWLNLIEPWWKQLRSLALKGRRFENMDELADALNGALDYWNAHRHPYRWKKRPQEQFELLGGFSVVRTHNISSI